MIFVYFLPLSTRVIYFMLSSYQACIAQDNVCDLPKLFHDSVLTSFLLLCSIPLHKYTTIYLSILLLMGIWDISSLEKL